MSQFFDQDSDSVARVPVVSWTPTFFFLLAVYSELNNSSHRRQLEGGNRLMANFSARSSSIALASHSQDQSASD